MAYGDLKCRNLIWNSGSGDNTVVLSTLATQSYVTTNFAPKANPTFTGTINGADLILSGNLTVSGTQTIINTNVLQVEDKHIEIGKVSSPSDTTADGGGIILKASSDRTFVWINSTDAWTSSEHIHLGDNKKLLLGTGGDLEIYHSGSHSNIKDAGTGQLNFWSNTFQFYNAAGNKTSMKIVEDAQVELYYDNSLKARTTSWGFELFGNIHADDDYSLNLGTSNDLRIYHDGSHSYIKDTGTGNLYIQSNHVNIDTDNGEQLLNCIKDGAVELFFDNVQKLATRSDGIEVTQVLTLDGSTPRIKMKVTDDAQSVRYEHYNTADAVVSRIYGATDGELRLETGTNGNQKGVVVKPAGAVEAYHNNNKKLETTSSGINVTGQINVNGSPLSAAPQITGTASGAIAAHKPVIVHTDGTLKEVTQTVTPRASASIGSDNVFKNQTLADVYSDYDPQSQTTVVLYRNSHFGQNPGIGRIQAIKYTAASATPTNGAQLDISWGANAYVYDLRYDPTSECMLALFNYNSESFFCSFTISGTTGTTESHDQIKAGATSSATLCPCPAAGKLFVFNAVGNRTEGWAYTNVGTGTSLGSWTHGNAVYLNGSSTGSESFLNSVYHSDSGKVVIIYRDNNDSSKLKSRVVSYDSSNNRLTFANSNDVTTSAVEDLALEYDPNANKLIALYRDNSNHLCFKIGTLSGTSISWGTKRTLQQNARYPKARYTSIGHQIFISYADSSNRWSYKYGVISGTDITIGTNAQGYLDSSVNDHDDHGGLAFDTSIAAIVASTVKYNNNRYGATRTAVLSDAVSNLTTGFAGFSDAAYSNGATATINVTGNTTTQSGLTAGTNYFVQNDGSLGTSAASAATVEAGLALSSTKLLIKG